MFVYVLVILFPIIGSMDSVCHKQCVCMKWVRLLQYTDLNPTEYSTFTVSMLWVEWAVFTTSIIDTNLVHAVCMTNASKRPNNLLDASNASNQSPGHFKCVQSITRTLKMHPINHQDASNMSKRPSDLAA